MDFGRNWNKNGIEIKKEEKKTNRRYPEATLSFKQSTTVNIVLSGSCQYIRFGDGKSVRLHSPAMTLRRGKILIIRWINCPEAESKIIPLYFPNQMMRKVVIK